MKFGLSVNANETMSEIVKKSAEAERLGLDYVWVSDTSEQLYAPVVASAIAEGTKSIKIGVGLLSAFLHSPIQIADSIITLIEAYGERFELCIGPGDRKQLEEVGISLSPLGGIQGFLLSARNQIEKAFKKSKIESTIWLGAQGPKILQISKFFDGVLLNYAQPDLIEWAITQIGSVEKNNFQLGVYSLSYVYEKFDPGIYNLLRISTGFVALGASQALLEKLGLYEKAARAKSGINDDSNVQSFAQELPLETVKQFSIVKSLRELGGYLSELRKLNIDHIVFSYPQSHSEKTLKELAKALNSHAEFRT
jgi:hypothetical protein